jgi:hypothetical protein
MAGSGFLPDRDADLLTWAQSASAFITATPTAYGLTAAIATAFASATSAYSTALEAVEPGVRSKMNVIAKNNAKAALKTNIRNWAKIVEGTATVTNAQKAQLGLNVRATPSPIPAPSDPPNLDVVSVAGRTVKIKLHDGTGARRGKPANVRGASVFSFTGATPPASVEDWKFEGQTSKAVLDVPFPTTLAPGATVWLTAFWIGTRMESGPACAPVSVTFGSAGVTTLAA